MGLLALSLTASPAMTLAVRLLGTAALFWNKKSLGINCPHILLAWANIAFSP